MTAPRIEAKFVVEIDVSAIITDDRFEAYLDEQRRLDAYFDNIDRYRRAGWDAQDRRKKVSR